MDELKDNQNVETKELVRQYLKKISRWGLLR